MIDILVGARTLTAEQIAKWAAIDPSRAEALIGIVGALEGVAPAKTIAVVLDLFAGIATDLPSLEDYATRVERPTLNLAAAAATFARQFLALQAFRRLIKEGAAEPRFQALFKEHHWMFGTRYVRRWTGRLLNVGNQQDFIMEAADGYFDVIEIKRPGHQVMGWDSTHKNFYPSVDLSKAVGQVQKYLEDIDHELPAIVRREEIRLHRPQATIVIGDLSDERALGDPKRLRLLAKRREALRGYNSHLSRITVRTYDEVLTMAEAIHGHTTAVLQHVLGAESAAKGGEPDDGDHIRVSENGDLADDWEGGRRGRGCGAGGVDVRSGHGGVRRAGVLIAVLDGVMRFRSARMGRRRGALFKRVRVPWGAACRHQFNYRPQRIASAH